jgi:hypothetical protein
MVKSIKHISKQEIEDLFKDVNWVLDEEAIQLQSAAKLKTIFPTYRHPNNTALFINPIEDKASLYQSRSTLIENLREILIMSQNPRPIHMLENRLPQGKDFIDQISVLIDQLPYLLNVDPSILDYTWESINVLHTSIKRILRKKCVEPPIFPVLVAYIGEVIRRSVKGGVWKRRFNSEFNLWEPWIVDANGKPYITWFDLYLDLVQLDVPKGLPLGDAIRSTTQFTNWRDISFEVDTD